LGVTPEFCARPNNGLLVPLAETPLTLVTELLWYR
jgi:hypothetical protein